MPMRQYINQLFCADSAEFLQRLDDKCIDLVLTDPPYFLDKLDNKWDDVKIADKRNLQVVRSLPAGMKFDRRQGIEFYNWYVEISRHLFRVLKPGGFFFSFSSPRLYHRLCQAVDDAGFNVRDMFVWLYTQNQPKAMGLDHFIDRMDSEDEVKTHIKEQFRGWKTPQVKSCFEPIVMAQKPTEGTYLENMLKYEVGLVNTDVKLGEGMFPSNVMTSEEYNDVFDRVFLVEKPKKEEKGAFNQHKTVKPLSICEYIIRVVCFSENAIVLDPFMGSGTTIVAARNLNFNYIGIDINESYINIAKLRLKSS